MATIHFIPCGQCPLCGEVLVAQVKSEDQNQLSVSFDPATGRIVITVNRLTVDVQHHCERS